MAAAAVYGRLAAASAHLAGLVSLWLAGVVASPLFRQRKSTAFRFPAVGPARIRPCADVAGWLGPNRLACGISFYHNQTLGAVPHPSLRCWPPVADDAIQVDGTAGRTAGDVAAEAQLSRRNRPDLRRQTSWHPRLSKTTTRRRNSDLLPIRPFWSG